jgi:hypothetical protein
VSAKYEDKAHMKDRTMPGTGGTRQINHFNLQNKIIIN